MGRDNQGKTQEELEQEQREREAPEDTGTPVYPPGDQEADEE